MRRLVILRPEPGGATTLARATAAGLMAQSIPLFAVKPVDWTAPDPGAFDAVLLTSANALRHGGAELARLTALAAYCVGDATAAAARAAGFTVAGIGSEDGAALAAAIPAGKRLLHLTGRDHRPIAGATVIAVYASEPIEPPPALDALRGGVAMVHSARAGKRLAALVPARGDIAIAAISQPAGQACGAGWREVAVAISPDDGALLALAADLCHKPGR